MRFSAKVDYAVRALAELADVPEDESRKGEEIASRQGIPLHFLENILGDLRRARVVTSQRGGEGGYRLAVPPDRITVADVIRHVEGPLADVHGQAPEDLEYPGPAAAVREVWVAARAGLRSVLEEVTIAHIASGRLPEHTRKLLRRRDAWTRR